MITRCKLRCTHKSTAPHHFDDGSTGVGAQLTFEAVHGATYDAHGKFESYKQTCEENKIFGEWTPSAHFTTYICNEAAHQQFEVGKEYYFDIQLAPTVEHHG